MGNKAKFFCFVMVTKSLCKAMVTKAKFICHVTVTKPKFFCRVIVTKSEFFCKIMVIKSLCKAMVTKAKFFCNISVTKPKFFCLVIVTKSKFFCYVRRSSVSSQHRSWIGWCANSKFCCFWPTTNILLDYIFAFTNRTGKLFAVCTKQLLADLALRNCIFILHLAKLKPQCGCFPQDFVNKIAACAKHCMRPNKASAHFHYNTGCLHCKLCRYCFICLYRNMRVRNDECLHFFRYFPVVSCTILLFEIH